MVSMFAGATPASLRLSSITPAVSVTCPAVPVSISTSFAPVFTSSAVNDTGSTLGGRKAAASASLTCVADALCTNLSSIGTNQVPS